MNRVFLALGSNEGDRIGWLNKGVAQIDQLIGRVIKRSSVYETAAWGKTDQPAFLNMAVELTTTLAPLKTLALTQRIEADAGRQRTEKWGARTLDIDILFYNDLVSNYVNLVLPHPFLHLRRFTLEPLHEIAPDFVHPALHQKISILLASCPDRLLVIKYRE